MIKLYCKCKFIHTAGPRISVDVNNLLGPLESLKPKEFEMLKLSKIPASSALNSQFLGPEWTHWCINNAYQKINLAYIWKWIKCMIQIAALNPVMASLSRLCGINIIWGRSNQLHSSSRWRRKQCWWHWRNFFLLELLQLWNVLPLDPESVQTSIT